MSEQRGTLCLFLSRKFSPPESFPPLKNLMRSGGGKLSEGYGTVLITGGSTRIVATGPMKLPSFAVFYHAYSLQSFCLHFQ